ncbi:MAG: hypothetical protein L3J83_06880 [Proteobacteria bacterium]|nr:hypothetical protein [Pseudomonadota bacterium]
MSLEINKFYFKEHKTSYFGWLIILLVLSICNVRAGEFYVLINADGGITAVDTLVQQGNQNPLPTNFLMETLTLFPPESVNYLIFDRPTGNLLDLVNQSPDWSQARLFRTLIIKYPFATDATPILQSFENDSLVESVDYQSAVLNPVVFEPEPLVAGDDLFVNIAMNSECRETGAPGLNIQGLSHNVNQVGNIIELEVIMNVFLFPPGMPTICLNQSNNFTQYSLGDLSENPYQLKIFKVYGNPPFPIDPSQRVFLGERNFQVLALAGSTHSIPIFNFFGVIILLLLMLIVVRSKYQHNQ